MDEKTVYWASVTLGGLALLLLVINMSVISSNRQMSDEIIQRKAALDGGARWAQIDQGVVQALASIAIKDNDTDAKALLTAQGITLTPPTAKVEEPVKDAKPAKETRKKSDE